jgi:hypothetical protein
MKYRNILFVIAAVSLIAGYGYHQLGGFRPVDLVLVECADLELVGKEFRGPPQDKRLSATFMEVEDVRVSHPGVVLHTIYYMEPAGKRDTMHLFVGVLKTSFHNGIPSMIEKQVTCSQAVVAKINAHRFVMPSPLRVKQEIIEYASQHGVGLQGIFVDKLIDDSHVEVWAPVIEG